MGPVNDNVASVVLAQLLFLQSESAKKPIHMYINSPGTVLFQNFEYQKNAPIPILFHSYPKQKEFLNCHEGYSK